jgi:hypothetical protein
MTTASAISIGAGRAAGPSTRSETLIEIERALAGCERYLRNTATFDRDDRLWPADQRVFSTNPLSIAYGACGTALTFRAETAGDDGMRERVIEWILRHEISADRYPPGFFVGLAGIAYALDVHDLRAPAEQVMLEVERSPLRFSHADFFYGAAGWGWTALHLFDRTQDEKYLTLAREAGGFLIESAETHSEGLSWINTTDSQVHLGFAHGASGIALFLLELWHRSGEDRFLDAAVRALDFDLAHQREDENGISWARDPRSTTMMPYLMHGAAGVGTSVLRFSAALQEPRYRALVDAIADAVAFKWSLHPGLMTGMAGLGEYLIDAYRYTGEERYYARACALGDTILWYQVERSEGTALPGDGLNKISNDYATGTAGVLEYFRRLIDPRRPRLVIDLPASPWLEPTRRAGTLP